MWVVKPVVEKPVVVETGCHERQRAADEGGEEDEDMAVAAAAAAFLGAS